MIGFLVRIRRVAIVGNFATFLLKLFCLELPRQVKLGKNVQFEHRAFGTIIHPNCTIEDNVSIYQGVTLGRADCYKDDSLFEGIVIKRGAVICAGAKVLCKKGVLVVGENTVIGANAVLLQSTGDNEVWAGIPAKRISGRKDTRRTTYY